MKEKDKDKKTGFTDFLKYRGNNLDGNEKNSFERELQKDPFAAEAEEGFSSVDPSLLGKDMSDLEKRLKTRTGNERRFVWYRIAASVAVLMVITTVFIIVQKEKPVEVAATEERNIVTFDIQKPEVLKENAVTPAIAENREMRTEDKSPLQEERRYNAAGAGKMKAADIVFTDTMERKADELISAAAEQEIVEPLPQGLKMAVPAKAATGDKDLKLVRGIVVSSEDNLPIPGATITIRGTSMATSTDTGGNFKLTIPEKTKPELIANYIGMKRKEINATADSILYITMDPDLTSLDEVVVVGYGVSAEEEKAYDNPSYIAAEPVTGKTAFNKYINQNIIRPISGTQKEVVVLSFTVKLNGQPSDIKVVRSPGKQFSNEAIRLIEAGPKWKPASANGINIEDEVRVRIVFK
jgi:hypothetical protein